MGSSRFRKAIWKVKDQTSIGLARVSSTTCFPDLDVEIVKATRHEDHLPDERHIREILSLTSCSHAYVSSCVSTISRRLDKTRNWVVTLKVLILIQRLLQDGNPAYEQEIFFATRRGTRLLNMSDFHDMSRSNTRDYSAFVRMYALYLDEQLEYRMQGKRGKHSSFSYEEDNEEHNEEPGGLVLKTPIHEMTNQTLFSRLQHLMHILERFLACWPTGAARNHRIVMVALYPIVKQSFLLYYEITNILSIMIDRFSKLETSESVKVYEILRQVGKQYDELDYFYNWCKSVGLLRTSEYPEVDKISQRKLDAMDEFIREKSVTGQGRIEGADSEEEESTSPEPTPELVPEPEMNRIKVLRAAPERSEEEKKEGQKTQDVGDLLNLGDDGPTVEEHSDKLSLALFDGAPATTAPATGASAWEAYKEMDDWETALVESASHLSNQKLSLPGGFNTLVLDGMYQQEAAQAAAVVYSGMVATGSPSSVVFGSAGKPAMLALPAPPSGDGSTGDPFSASLAVAPPPYVQMAEMEKKQRLLAQEQMMWQQYRRDGLQIQPNQHPYHTGGSMHPT